MGTETGLFDGETKKAASVIVKQMKKQNKYTPALLPLIKTLSIAYGDLIKVQRSMRDEGVNIDKMKLKVQLMRQVEGMTKTLGLTDLTIEEVGDEEDDTLQDLF